MVSTEDDMTNVVFPRSSRLAPSRIFTSLLLAGTFPLSRARWTLDSSLSDSWQHLQPPHELVMARLLTLSVTTASAHLSSSVCAKRGSCVCGMRAGTRQVEHRVCVQTALVYSAKVAMPNDPSWFQVLSGTVSTLTGQANSCLVSSRW